MASNNFDASDAGYSSNAAGLQGAIAKFNNKASENEKKLEKNPFSGTYSKPEHKVTDDRYGRPEQGSLTEKRGIAAGKYVSREMTFLCEIIDKYGQKSADGVQPVTITFGLLFDLYSNYSDKLVGMLLRCRKYGLVHFVGEMLYQRQDEKVVITLLKTIDEIKASFADSGDPANCLARKT